MNLNFTITVLYTRITLSDRLREGVYKSEKDGFFMITGHWRGIISLRTYASKFKLGKMSRDKKVLMFLKLQ